MKLLPIFIVFVSLLMLGCEKTPLSQPPSPTPRGTPTPAATPVSLFSLTQLKYRLIERFGLFYCDPDYYPIGRPGQEEQRALEEFPRIQSDSQEFQAIAQHLGLQTVGDFSAEQQLLVYREHKKLRVVQLQSVGEEYKFELRTGQGPEGLKITGSIDRHGGITIQGQERSFNTCPICLAQGTLISTPNGPIPLQDLVPGMAIWTANRFGQRIEGIVEQTGSTPVPEDFSMVHLILDDGRELLASPGHPLADGRRVGDLFLGDEVDGARAVTMRRVPYKGSKTYDILPSGDTGHYWANGIRVSSTLAGAP